ncbi:ribonuclease T [Parasphingopyxis algicola]|uniref:ribonuclease T2 family protein n=1 Tax=Parasphingopyxis algicola TaxID=2026624 RepID=UPI0015A48EB1|nr:ribonuclease T [Parasphingopyxis algicola]QLC24672.1 ribonuclease T [Parasphingopyxis algicola]
MRRWWAALALLVLPSILHAQARECRIPDRIAAPRAVSIPPGERRTAPVTNHLLALSWSPEFCRTRGRDPAHRLQCGGIADGGAGQFGFILHGLWPETNGPRWPQWCRPVPALSRATVREHLCTTPSVRLIQREWAKHGSCMTRDPRRYLRAGSILYRAVRYPDMNTLSRRNLTVRQFAQAFAAANRGVSPDMVSVQSNGRGWLTEVRICLGRDFRPRRCPRWQRGARPNERLRIWRGR